MRGLLHLENAMPRNGSGTSSVLNTFVPDTVADANAVNANFVDIADQLTNSLPRDGQAGMVGQFLAIPGTEALPGIAFNGDADTGFRRVSANAVALTCGGVDIVTFDASGITINTGAISGGNNTVKPGMSMIWNSQTIPAGWHEEDGAALLISSYPDLATNIYVGNTLNATAAWGYKCTDPLNPNTTRSTSGTYIVLPDSRGEFMRGWDHGRGIDTGRAWASAQADELKSHTHTGTTDSAGAHTHPVPTGGTGGGNAAQTGPQGGNGITTGSSGAHTHPFTTAATGGTETRPRNLARMFIIYIGGN